jgi:hypothetical protein
MHQVSRTAVRKQLGRLKPLIVLSILDFAQFSTMLKFRNSIIIRRLSSNAGEFKPIIGKHMETFPFTLFRMMNAKTPKLKMREQVEQAAKGAISYDFVANEGKIVPLHGKLFSAPNGMSLRPNTLNEFNLISDGTSKYILEIPKGTVIPVDTILIHEFADHFSLQPKIPMDPREFETKVVAFLKNMKVHTKAEWVAAHPLGSQIDV